MCLSVVSETANTLPPISKAMPLPLQKRVADITSGKSTHGAEEPFSNPELAAIAANIEEMTETSQARKTCELKLILEPTSDGIFVLDNASQVILYNRRFLELWDLG